MINRIPLKLEDMLARIKDPSDAFTFSRWGDGEWLSVIGTGRPCNRDGHRYFPEMGKELLQVLTDRPDYVMGIQGLTLKIMGKKVSKRVESAGLGYVQWVDSDVFHQASSHGHLYRVVEAINTRKVLMVGPSQLRKVNLNANLPLQYWSFVEVPALNAYLGIDQVIGDIKRILTEYSESESISSEEPLLISVSASLPAGIILHKIYPLTKGRHTVIDFGCLWDPLVGIATAGYHKKIGVDTLVASRSKETYVTEAMGEVFEPLKMQIKKK